MIGGTDIMIPAVGDTDALDACARVVLSRWPHARFEDAVTGEKFARYGDIPLGRVRELFAYPDDSAEAAWDADSADSPPNSMLYLILSPDCVTVVLDDPDTAEMRVMLEAFRTMLETDILKTYYAGGSMNQQSAAVLERLLRDNDLAWIIDRYTPRDRLIPSLVEQLDRVSAEYRSRIRVDVSFTPEALTAEAERNPHKVRAFLQAMRATQSPEMLVMVWRILQGLSIRKVEMKYQELEAFNLLVALARPEEPSHLEEYRSEDIMDVRLLWNFGVGTVGEKPLFAGFSPPREKRRQPGGPSLS